MLIKGRSGYKKIILVLLIFLSFIVLSWRGYLKKLGSLFLGLSTFGTDNVRDKVLDSKELFGVFLNINKIKKSSEILRETEIKNRELELKNKKLEEENKKLRNNLELLPREALVLINAEVVSHDIQAGSEFLIINKGEKQGIKKGMAVIIEEKIFIGEVYETSPERSKIILSTSPLNAFDVFLEEKKITGIAEGYLGTSIIMKKVSNNIEVKLGEKILTAGRNKKYPEGLLVGEVVQVNKSLDGLFQEIVVKSYYNVGDLRFLSVVY